ncbi:hypothetical protein HQ531_01140 [bacterium]|nr:hypothetical protein [bacterium]
MSKFIAMLHELHIPNHLLWTESLKKNPISVLMKAAPLPVRYQVLRDILEEHESEDLDALLKNLRKHQIRRKRLGEQNAQGLWPIDGSLKGLDADQLQTLQFLKQIEVLHELLDLLVTHKQEKVLMGMREVIRYLAETKQSLRFHHLTQSIYLAIKFELDGNPIIKQLIWEILKKQNSDGGWSSLAEETESCLWSSLFFLWTMGHSTQFLNNRSLEKGLAYVKKNLLSYDQSQLLPGIQVWDTLHSGTSGLSVLSGGTLRYLETLQLLEGDQRDRKIDKLLDWLIENQLKNGLWPSIVNRDRQGDYAVTLRVLKVLKHYQTQRVIETLNYESS